MPSTVPASPASWGRCYFAFQSGAGLAWWILVFGSTWVRDTTLGGLDPVLVAIFDVPLFVIASAAAALGSRAAAKVTSGWTVTVAVVLGLYATITTHAGWGVLLMGAASAGSLVAACLMMFGRVPTEWILKGPFAFRAARESGTAVPHLARTMLQLLFFWGLFLGLIPWILAFLEQRWGVAAVPPAGVGAVGASVFLLGSALGVSSAITMSTLGRGTPLPSAMPNRLVIAGPYRWVRNPMAVAGIGQGVAVGLMLGSWMVVTYAAAGSLVWNYAVRPLEEADLEGRFGEDFRSYRANVQCWIPRLPARS
ncbi:methyltransferase family protein [Paenarthrobacter sp. NPDC089714]|uniref:methyltransferase family protein n=1 Tax=Paenarthrobacter sp. NPDC089714 TaxID=3364377 RepID=UPI0037F91CB3